MIAATRDDAEAIARLARCGVRRELVLAAAGARGLAVVPRAGPGHAACGHVPEACHSILREWRAIRRKARRAAG